MVLGYGHSVLGVYLVTAVDRKAHGDLGGGVVNRVYHKPRKRTRVANKLKSFRPLWCFVVRQRSGTTWSRWFV